MPPKDGDEFLKYEIKSGIFKRICDSASGSYKRQKENGLFKPNN